VAWRLTATRLGEDGERERRSGWLEIHRMVDGKIAETWGLARAVEVGPWEGVSYAPEQWAIASESSLTSEEQANLKTLNHWADLNQNRRDDFEALDELLMSGYRVHDERGLREPTVEARRTFLVSLKANDPTFTGGYDDLVIAGDRACAQFHYDLPQTPPGTGTRQSGLIWFRFADHRIAEMWQINLPDDADW